MNDGLAWPEGVPPMHRSRPDETYRLAGVR